MEGSNPQGAVRALGSRPCCATDTMRSNYSQYVLRKPRHPAARPAAVCLTLPPRDGEARRTLAAKLLDLSREGFRLSSPVEVPVGEPLSVKLPEDSAPAGLELQGSVRWRQQQADGRWLLGCQTAHPLDWEILGELFLANVLTTEPRPTNG